MKKKNKIIIFIVSFLIIISLIIGVGLIFIVKVGLPYIRHENMLKTDTDLLCLTLSVAHGCSNENYNEEELEKYLKEDVLTKISLEEAEEIILKAKNNIPAEYRETTREEAEKEINEKKKEICKKYYKNQNLDKCYRENKSMTFFATPSRRDYFLSRILLIIQKLKQEGIK